jgi:hypothetical protein
MGIAAFFFFRPQKIAFSSNLFVMLKILYSEVSVDSDIIYMPEVKCFRMPRS